MTGEERSLENLARDERYEHVIVYSDLLRAARAGWRWIVGLTLLATVVSVVWDARRPPLYEAHATIRVGWVHDGVNTVPIEPIEDLAVMVKQERFLKPFFEGMGAVDKNEQDEFVASLSITRPQTNILEFRSTSMSREGARIWLERLISKKVAEHDEIVNDFIALRQRFVAECYNSIGVKNAEDSTALLSACSPQQLMIGYPVPPLMARTVISQSVHVEESSLFPSLPFLMVVSVLGGLGFGTLISFILKNHKWRMQSNSA